MKRRIVLIFLGLLYCIILISAEKPHTISLAGEWRFALDSTDIGEREKWFNKRLEHRIKLPGITDEGGYGPEVLETGKLTRLHKYIGKAWYQLDIVIPKQWKDRNVEIYLERVMWRSKLWVDQEYIGMQESLSTPHTFSLGKLSPGKHTLTLNIDSREIYPIGAVWSHSYGEQTQIIWNGVIGKMEMSAHPDLMFEQVRTFPDATGKLDVEFSLLNKEKRTLKSTLSLQVKEKSNGKVVHSATFPLKVSAGKNVIRKSLTVKTPQLWDEYSPNLYTLECFLQSKEGKDEYAPISFGFRTLDKTEDFITLNGLPRYLRGNLDNSVFPLTGYPPMDKDSWLRIFKLYKAYGLNHARFHSWTPPAAAFEAADEVGIYVLCEIFWRDGWMGKGLDVVAVEPFLRPELKRIADAFGNHPSMIAQAMGNEMGGFDLNLMDPWIKEVKEYDPRHFYVVSVRRPPTAHADINFHGDLSAPYPLLYIDEGRLSTDWDYAPWYGKASPLPSVQHEVGQWTIYPNWNETEKYVGNLRARGLEKYKKMAKESGVYEQNAEFIQSSGLQSVALYKENIESLLRTPLCGGFQLLSIQDFSGQGEALVGWVDAFYDDKGVVKPEQFRNWCNTTVPLMRTSSYMYSSTDTLNVDIEVFRFDRSTLPQAAVEWKVVSDAGEKVASGVFKCDIQNACVNKVGHIQVPLSSLAESRKLVLEVSIQGTEYRNAWNFWVFSDNKVVLRPSGVLETHSLSDALNGLKAGKTVFLWAYGLGSGKNAGYALWKPTFWQGGEWGNEGFTNGAVVRKDHPALADFPTDHYLDFQWYDICKGAHGFDMKGLPFSIRPIVQPIHDFHFNRKLGSILEFHSKEGGRILICGYNLVDNIENRPAALSLRNSLMRYVASDEFCPKDEVHYDWMKEQLLDQKAPYLAPDRFQQAFLYVKSGGRCTYNGTLEWSSDKDAITFYETDKYGYNVVCENIYSYESLTVWQGKDIQLDLKLPFQFDGSIHLFLFNPSGKAITVNVLFNGKETPFEIPSGGKWLSFQMKAGEALLGKISILLKSTTADKLWIGELAVMPKIVEAK